MFNEALRFAIPLVGLFLNSVSQVITFRAQRRKSLLSSVLSGFLAGTAGLFFLEMFLGDKADIAAGNALTYILLSYGYFHFLNLGETSRRIRLSREIAESAGGLARAEILARYSTDEIIRRRLGRLMESGQIVSKDGRFYINSLVMLSAAKIIAGLRFVLLGRSDKIA